MKIKETGNPINSKYRKYEVDSRECPLNILDMVAPGTVIGSDYKNAGSVRSDLYGRVATMYYNPKHDSLIVMIVASDDRSPDEHNNSADSGEAYIPGLSRLMAQQE